MKRCAHCAGEFAPRRSSQRFCSSTCRSMHWAANNAEARQASLIRHREANRERIREINRRYRRANPERVVEIGQRYREANPEKYQAHTQVSGAIRSGRLVRPDACSSCGEKARVHAHHRDYSRPLDVEWLCPMCHKSAHAQESLR